MSDKQGWRANHRGRDPLLVTLGAVGIALIAVVMVVGIAVLANRSDVLTIKEGRQLGIVSSCTTNKAIIAAGRRQIEGSVLLPGDRIVGGVYYPGDITRSLGSNFPSYEKRKAKAEAAGAAYEKEIVNAITIALLGAGAKEVPLDENGHLDCERYARVLKAD